MANNYKQLYENNNGSRESFYPKSVGEAIIVKEGENTTLADFYDAYSELTKKITSQNNIVALKGTTIQYRCFASSVLSVKDLQNIEGYAQDNLWEKDAPDVTKALPNLWKRIKNTYTDGTEDTYWNYSLQAALSANSYATQAVYKLVADGSTPTINEASGSTSNEGFIPEGWQRNQPSLQKGYKIWRSERNYITDQQKWSSFSDPAIWAVYPESGTTTIISRDTTTVFGSGSFFVDTSAVTATFNYSCNVSGYYVIAFQQSNSSAYFVSSNNSNTDANKEVSLIFKQGLLSSTNVSSKNCTFIGLNGAYSSKASSHVTSFGWGTCTYAVVTLYKDSTASDILWQDTVTRTGMDGHIFNVGDTSLTSIYSYQNAISTLQQTAQEITTTCSSLSPNIVKQGACKFANNIPSTSTISSQSNSALPSGYYIVFTNSVRFDTDSMDQSVQYQLSFYATTSLTCAIGNTEISVSQISDANKWKRYGGSFTLSILNNSSITFSSSSQAQISSVQIEKGSIITDWKDYGTDISSVIQTAQSQISTFTSQLNTLQKSYNSIKNTAEGTQQIVESQLWNKNNNSIGTALSNSITNAVQTEVAKLDTSTGQSSEWKQTAQEISQKINSYAPNLCKGGACTQKVISNSWIKSSSGQSINSSEVTDASSVTYSDDGAAANITNSITLKSTEAYEFPLAITVPSTTAVIISFWYYSTSEETSSIQYGWNSSSFNSPSKVIKNNWTWCTNTVTTISSSNKTSLYLKGTAKIANVQVEIATFQKLDTTSNTLVYVPSHYHEYGSDYGSYTINTIDGVKTTVTDNAGRISQVEQSAIKVESTLSGIAGNMCLGAACDSNAVNNYYISYCETSGVVSTNSSEWKGATVPSDSTQLTSYVVLKKDDSVSNKIKFKVNPFISDQTYIISFYAKCDSDTVQLQCNAAVSGNAYDKDNPTNQYITVDTTWKRYAFTLAPTYKGDNPSVELQYLVLFFKENTSQVNTSIAKMLIQRGEILNKWQDYGTDELSQIRQTAEDITLQVANTALSLNADGTIVANVQGKTQKSGLTITESGSTFTGKVAADTFALTNLATSFSPAENEVLWFTTIGALQSQFPNDSELPSDSSDNKCPVMIIKSNGTYYFTKLTALGTPSYIPESNLYNLQYDTSDYHVTVTEASVFKKTENSQTKYYQLNNGNYVQFTGGNNYFYKLLYKGYVLQKSASEVCYVTYGEVYQRINYTDSSYETQNAYITLFKEITISSTLYSSSESLASTTSTVTTASSAYLGRTGTLSATFSDYYVSGVFTSTKNSNTISITNYCTSDTALKNSFDKTSGGYYSKNTGSTLAANLTYYIYTENTWKPK